MPIDVFISYASSDKPHLEQLERHLAGLVAQGILRLSSEDKIAPGEDRIRALYRQIDRARVALVLVTANYLASDKCRAHDLVKLQERRARNDMRVVPIIVAPCLWTDALGGLDEVKALPYRGKPVTQWSDPDQAWTDVARGIDALARSILAGSASISTGPTRRSFVSETSLDAGRPSPAPRHAPVPSQPVASTPLQAPVSMPSPASVSRGASGSVLAQRRSAPSSSSISLGRAAVFALLLPLVGAALWMGLSHGEGGEAHELQRSARGAGASNEDPSRSGSVFAQGASPGGLLAPALICASPCCAGSACMAPLSPPESCSRRTAEGIAICFSGRDCVPGACNTPLALDRRFLLRLARVDLNKNTLLDARLCAKKSSSRERETCLETSEAADMKDASPGAAMASRLPVSTRDLLAGGGLDITIDTSTTRLAQQSSATVPGEFITTAALCIGLRVNVGPAAVYFYMDDP
jgi:TIR domain